MERSALLTATTLLTMAIVLGGGTTRVGSADDQDPKKAVRNTINQLFDGMREGDSTKVRSTFADVAVIGRPRSENGVTTFDFRSIDRFVAAVGRPHDAVWDERIGAVVIHTDGHLASAWMEYAFYLGVELHHCGVNSMQLVRLGSSWKIVTLLDTNRGLKCSGDLDS